MAAPEYLTITELPVGTTGLYEFSFAGGYLEQAHVKLDFVAEVGARVNYPLTAGMFVTQFTLQIPIVDVPADTASIRIYRETPRDAPLVNFSTGSRLTERNLDRLAQQTIFVAAEAYDAGAFAVAEDLIGQALTAIEQTQALIDQAQGIVDTAADSASTASAAQISASASASTATGSAASATASASTALAQAGLAVSSRDAAALSASAAAASAASATASATTASQAATTAADAAAAAAISLDNFDDRYLGAKTNPPTADNDGGALLIGALYWSIVLNQMYVWNGTQWRVTAGNVSLPVSIANGGTGATTSPEAWDALKVLAGLTDAQNGTGDGMLTPTSLRLALNAIGNAPVYACRAWAVLSVGSLVNSGNVASVTTTAPGDYTFNFSTPLPVLDYAVSVSIGTTAVLLHRTTTQGPTALRVQVTNTSGTLTAPTRLTISIFC